MIVAIYNVRPGQKCEHQRQKFLRPERICQICRLMEIVLKTYIPPFLLVSSIWLVAKPNPMKKKAFLVQYCLAGNCLCIVWRRVNTVQVFSEPSDQQDNCLEQEPIFLAWGWTKCSRPICCQFCTIFFAKQATASNELNIFRNLRGSRFNTNVWFLNDLMFTSRCYGIPKKRQSKFGLAVWVYWNQSAMYCTYVHDALGQWYTSLHVTLDVPYTAHCTVLVLCSK